MSTPNAPGFRRVSTPSTQDAPPSPGHRILVAGPSGCGKTTLAARIAERLDIPHTEIDALHHGPNWTPRPEFVADVHAFTAEDRWVTEWQYDQVRQHLLDRATLLVHLDLPRATVMQQVVRRTLRRRLRREQLWNGNVESPLHTIFTDPEHIVRWSWAGIEKNRRKVAQVRADHPGLPVVTLHSHRQADEWLAGLP